MNTTIRTTLTAAALVALAWPMVPAGPLAAQAGHGAGLAGVPQLFDVAGPCMACHNGLVGPTGEDLSFGTDWRPSMMANAARDPYWQAGVRRETLEHPDVALAIQDECSKCHMPMARFTAHTMGQEHEAFSRFPWRAPAGPLAALAADGVSCTMCHQVEADGLGAEETFTGGFHVDTDRPMGQRVVYGPYAVPGGRARAMLSSGRFQPTQSAHIQESSLCASCHTLYTHSRNEAGEVIGELPEQVPFLEWLHSDYAGERSCQSCHMPVVEGATAISSVLPNPRENVSRHVFRGGNFFMPRVFNAFRNELAVQALPLELETLSLRTRENLRTRTAGLAVEGAVLDSAGLAFDVVVVNQAGHKLPTAYPSRRAWLHVVVTGPDGAVLFESGALRPDGSIVGNDNDRDPTRFEPHYGTIRGAEEVQVYETIMVDAGGRVTTGLLRGARFAKDNRVLPAGFDKATADPDVAVRGHAADDPDFSGGGDRVRYEIDATTAGPITIRAELWYQPIGFRWAHNLEAFDAVETARFVRYFDALSEVSAALVARASARVEVE